MEVVARGDLVANAPAVGYPHSRDTLVDEYTGEVH